MNSTIYDRLNAGKERNMKKFLCLFLVLSLVCIHPAGQAATYTRVEDTAVALMDITFSCGCTRMGAGTMIAVNGLITAGHNLLCSKHNQKLKTCTFYFGFAKQNDWYYEYNGSFTYRYYCDFSSGYSSKDDIGYIVFPSNIGNKTGWYASTIQDDYGLSWEYTNASGYKNGRKTSDWNQITVVNSKQVKWSQSSSFQGSCEGGPLYWFYEGLTYPQLIGVYTSFSGSTGYGRRLTNQVFNDMKKDGVTFN